MEQHPPGCTCGQHGDLDRRDFIKMGALLSAGLGFAPVVPGILGEGPEKIKELDKNAALRSGKAQKITLLHTADIHAQLHTHDEFFWENGQAVYKRRGGMAVLKTMLHKLRAENPANTLLIDGGDCFQGGGLAALTQGEALIPMINDIGYDLMLPGNWEVVYGKNRMLHDLGSYNAAKVCANMWHDTADEFNGDTIFPPYWTKMMGGVKVGFIGYNDPLTPKRQSPGYSKGIRFAPPETNVKKLVRVLREQEHCTLVFLVTHMGLAQQVGLANLPDVEGVDFILGADTHERIRQPIQGKYTKVTEPGAFASFVSRLDIIVENGVVKDTAYALLDVDPEKYKADKGMQTLVRSLEAPYEKQLHEVIGATKVPLVRYFVIETPMDNLITDALKWQFPDVDIVLSNGFRFCPPLVPDAKTGVAEITRDYLWSMLPVDSDAKRGRVSGKQLWNWLEKELENAFAANPAKRFGGWLVRFKGMEINFTIGKNQGERLNWVKVDGKPLEMDKTYSIAACERDGDPDDTLCRIEKVMEPKRTGHTLHAIMEGYLNKFSPVAPKVEGRATATDAPPTLLTQLQGYNYEFK